MTANSFALKLTNPAGGGAERAESLSRRPVKLTARPADCNPFSIRVKLSSTVQIFCLIKKERKKISFCAPFLEPVWNQSLVLN
jgi:hypothetical protein